jgi:hypothetical protein
MNYNFGLDAMNNPRKSISGDKETPKIMHNNNNRRVSDMLNAGSSLDWGERLKQRILNDL